MILKNIHLGNFRNYESLDLEFHPKLNVFIGRNAQGKTNLLESIYFLALAKSHSSVSNRRRLSSTAASVLPTVTSPCRSA